MMRTLLAEVDNTTAHPALRWLAVATVVLCGGVPLLVLRGVDVGAISGTIVLTLLAQIIQYPMLALGCVAGGHQFGAGVWQRSLLAVPRRIAVVSTQALVVLVVAALVAVFSLLPFLALVALFGEALALSDAPHVAGVVGYLTIMTVLGWALAFTCRSVVAALGTLCACLLVVPVIAGIVGAFGYLPGGAGAVLADPAVADRPGAHPAWLVLWAGSTLGVAALSGLVRDCGE